MGRNRKNLYDKDSLLLLLQEHKEHLTSTKAWNEYAKQHQLPHSSTLIKNFGSWNLTKEAFSLEQAKAHRPVKYTSEQLLEILDNYKSKFTNIYDWNMFASENQLPTFQTFERYLGKEFMEEQTGAGGTIKWDEDKLKELIKSNFPSKPPTVKEWNLLAKEKQLPTHMTIIAYFNSWNLMKHRVYHS
ncbi:hypothetical protein MKZ20_21480 [Psychrobacillus sp. FSL K6-2684]|uniref:hypothetical protein n=1 Tax=Psychrobacillus sp. FSL K6-2684 TaxID=2921547 RepID=UPI0030F55F45